jgi:hypothetical protein
VDCGNVDAENWPSPSSVGNRGLIPDSEQLAGDELPPEVPLEPEVPEDETPPRTEEETPASGPTLASLDGRPIETNGDVLDNYGNVIASVIDGKPRLRAKKNAKCDTQGNVVYGSRILGTVGLVLPMPETPPPLPPPPAPEELPVGLEVRSLAGLEGLSIDISGHIYDDANNMVGRLVEGSAPSLYAKFAVCTADGQVISNGKILKKARVEIIQPEDKKPVEEPTICPERVDHMLNGGNWKACSKCRGSILEMANQL